MFAVIAIAACTSAVAARASATHLTLAGSSTVQPLAEVAAQAYEGAHPGTQIDVQGGGSSVGISSTRSGLAGMGMVSRKLKADERDLVATTIALDGIALIVNAANPLDHLNSVDVVAIYTGAKSNWLALGGADRPITVVNKEEGRATLDLFQSHFGLKGKFVPTAVIIGPNGQAITTVASNPDAIAYVSIGSAAVAEGLGTAIKRLPLDGVAATTDNVANDTYTLTRPLNIVTRGHPTGLAAAFAEFILSPDGQKLVAEQDFIPLPQTLAAGG